MSGGDEKRLKEYKIRRRKKLLGTWATGTVEMWVKMKINKYSLV